MNEDIPFLLKNNIEMLKYWIIGLIDGDGSIVLSNRTLSISILGSKQIIEYLFNMLTYGKMNQRKNYDNLYELNFYNHNCIDLREWLGEAVNLGLKHKWNKINEFMLTYS
jgi:hypothetical protein